MNLLDGAISHYWIYFPLPRSVLSLTVVVVVYWAYCLLVVPLVEPQFLQPTLSVAKSMPTPSNEPPADGGLDDLWHPLFEAGNWELEKPKVLKTSQFTLLFQDYKTLDDGRMKLEPCTAVFHPRGIPRAGGPGSQRVFILQAPEGALLEFDGQLDLRRGSDVRLIGGQLMGTILIHSPESKPGAGDGLRMETQEVSLTSDRIRTPHQVTFRYGNSFGSGRDLNIQLLVDQSAGDSDQPFSAVSGLHSLELAHVDRIHLEVSEEALPDSSRPPNESATSQAVATASSAPSQVQVEISCQGRFFFNFLDRTARFEQQVDVLHMRPDGVGDQLNCQTLKIKFSEVNPIDLNQGEQAVTSRESHLPKLQPHSLIAWGHPAIARSTAVDFEARAKRIVYDVKRRRIRLDGGETVSLRHGRHVIETPETEYELPAAGAAVVVGRWWADGPGALHTLPGENEVPRVSAAWQDEARLRPQNEFHVLSLVGGSTIALDATGRISAEDIHCWMSQQPREELADGPLLQGPTNGTGEFPGLDPSTASLAPERLMALRNVQIKSPRFVGRTEHLEAWLTDGPDVTNSDLTVQPVAQNARANHTIERPARPDESRQQSPLDRSGDRQLYVQGDKISLEIERGSGEPMVRDVSVDGNVHVAEVPSSASLPRQPWSIAGNTLCIHNASSLAAEINVQGAPSEIRFGGLVLVGDEVQLQRQDNRLRMAGPGSMTIPLNRDLNGQALDHPIDLNVSWRGRMDFDGAVIHFENSIHVQTPNRQIRSDIMDVQLTQRVDLKRNDPNPQVEVRGVEFNGRVRADNRSVEYGHLKSIDMIEARSLAMDRETGKILATGPGLVKSVRYGRLGIGGIADQPVSTASGPADEVALIFLKVEYQKTISGNIRENEKQLHFEDNVRTVYGPIPHWTSELDPDGEEGLGSEGILLTCRRLSVYDMGQSGDGRRAMELFAIGNTLVEGAAFTARAHRITYATDKDLLVMTGGRGDAELWYRPANRQRNVYYPAREIQYWPRTRQVKVHGAGTPAIQYR